MNTRIFRFVIVLAVSTCTMISCSGKTEISPTSRPDLSSIPVYSPQLSARITEFGNDEFFGNVRHVQVASDNTIFVGDLSAKKIYMFDENGNYSGFLGGEGRGPGEIQQLFQMEMFSSDTLYSNDWQNARITLFARKDGKWQPIRYLTPPPPPIPYGGPEFFSLSSMWATPFGVLFNYSTSFTPADTSEYVKEFFSFRDFNLNETDATQRLKETMYKVLIHREQGRSVSMFNIPFSHMVRSLITSTGSIVRVYPATQEVRVFDVMTLDTLHTFVFPSRPVAVTAQEKREYAERMIPNPEQSVFTREALDRAAPDMHPPAREALLDEKDRLWIRVWPFEEGDPEWLIFTLEGDLVGAVHHPGGNVRVVRSDRIVTQIGPPHDDENEPGIVMYRF